MKKLKVALLLAGGLTVGLVQQFLLAQDAEEHVKARPVYAEFQTIMSMVLDECYWNDNQYGAGAESAINGYLTCAINLLSEVKREGVGAWRHSPDEEDVTTAEDGNATIRPRKDP